MIPRPRLQRAFQQVRQSSLLPKIGSRFFLLFWPLLVLYRVFMQSGIIQKTLINLTKNDRRKKSR